MTGRTRTARVPAERDGPPVAATPPTSGAAAGAAQEPAPEPAERDPDLVLAGLHLRLGSMALARVELEVLAGQGRLDRDALVDLAEVLWRTGDLAAAAEAANTAIEAGDDSATAFAVAAEAMAELGRPSEARRLAGRALERVPDAADVVFAGMPRSAVWPPDPSEPPAPAATLFHPESSGPAIRTTVVPGRAEFSGANRGPGQGPGLWDDHEAPVGAMTLPDAADELAAGQAALAAGELDRAALRFGLAIRLSPALAPAVLDAITPGSGSALDIVRGDAYRLVGHEREAMESYAIAAANGAAANVPATNGASAPPGRLSRTRPADDPIHSQRPHPTPAQGSMTVTERTLVLVKPDGVQRLLTGRILARYEERGLKLVGLKLVHVDRALAERHYAEHRERPFFGSLVDFIVSAPLVALALEGPNAIAAVRAINGATRPHEAAPGTIRGDFALETAQNVVHASDGPETAVRELELWFSPEELHTYVRDVDRWVLAPED